jgi:two-component system cell cycle sensor histidine kinase/response regulator CckA
VPERRSIATQAAAGGASSGIIAEHPAGEEGMPPSHQKLRHTQKLEAVGRLASGIAHEFNNQLSIMLPFLRSALHELPPEHPMREELDDVLAAAERAQSLTEQLLAFSRLRAMRPRVVAINDLVAKMHRMLMRLLGKHVLMEMHLEAGLPPVRLDPDRFALLLVNLALNARDAMPSSGRLAISTRRELGRGLGGPRVVLEVRDDGVGMTEDVRAKIFEPFFTTKEESRGTGLGLATCREIADEAGGSIEVRSAPGRGSTFVISFPVAHDPATQ